MRRTMFAAASAVLLACLGACANDSDGGSDETVAVQPAASATPTSLDPFAWTDVSYAEYLEAAEQIGLRPDVLVAEAGFSSGLNTLCHTSAEEMAVMRSSHVEDVADSGTYSTAKYLGDEIGLRLGMACPQRMTDWTAAGLEQDGTDPDEPEEQSTVTDDDLDRATAEEVAEDGTASEVGYDSDTDTDTDTDTDDESDGSDESDSGYHHDGGTGSSSSSESTDSTGGSTTGNGDQQN
jgi:hypothetical protein